MSVFIKWYGNKEPKVVSPTPSLMLSLRHGKIPFLSPTTSTLSISPCSLLCILLLPPRYQLLSFPKSKQSSFSLEEHIKGLLLHMFSLILHIGSLLSVLRIPQPFQYPSFMTLVLLKLVLWLFVCRYYFPHYTTKVSRIIFLSELS